MTDVLIVGAGPVGLYATYYAGFRGFSVTLLDALPDLGGQVTAMYPEKAIRDVAGFPEILGRELVDRLVEQAMTAAPTLLLGREASEVRAGDDSVIITAGDERIEAKAVVITGGLGRFEPRPLPAAAGFHGTGVYYFVRSPGMLRGERVVVVGGGDSALDWALMATELAERVTLVHRRAGFRGHEASIERLRASDARILAPAQLSEIHGGDRVEAVTVSGDGWTERIEADLVIAALGFTADMDMFRSWPIELAGRHIVVDRSMATSCPRVFAAGDIATYPGKVALLATGFGEAATAINNAAPLIRPDERRDPRHSSDL